MATTVTVTGDIGRRPQLGMMRSELAHVLRRRQGLIGAEGLVVLARAEGLSDVHLAPPGQDQPICMRPVLARTSREGGARTPHLCEACARALTALARSSG